MKFIPRFDIRLVRDGRVATLEPTIIRHPSDTLPILEAELSELGYERFVALALNTKNHLTAVLPVSSGSLNASIVHPRELFQRAILANSAALIVAHNHPSGDPQPSQADIAMTRKVVEAARVFDIPVHDHLVVGREGTASFRQMGLLP